MTVSRDIPPDTGAAPDGALDAVLAQLTPRLDALVEQATETIFAENPTYSGRLDSGLRRDVALHVHEHFSAVLRSLSERRAMTREDLLFIRGHAAARVGHLSLADFIHAFQVGQRVLWETTVGLATDADGQRAVLDSVTYILRYFDVATTHAAEVYLEAEKLLGEAGERVRRDTLDDLLSGTPLIPGPRLQTARDAGLGADTPCFVMAASAVGNDVESHALRGAAAALARVPRRAVAPLSVIRQEEVIVITPASTPSLSETVSRLHAVQGRLADGGVPMAIGMSTVHPGLGAVPAAYAEATEARALADSGGGVVALSEMRAFDFLLAHSSSATHRLIPEETQRFLEEDAASGGQLIATLEAYARADLSVKRAAELLHVHVNTAHYRLARIAERTGADLRHLSDLIELLIAARLVRGARPTQARGPGSQPGGRTAGIDG